MGEVIVFGGAEEQVVGVPVRRVPGSALIAGGVDGAGDLVVAGGVRGVGLGDAVGGGLAEEGARVEPIGAGGEG